SQPQDWVLSVNGVQYGSGVIGGSVPRSNLNDNNVGSAGFATAGKGSLVCAGGTVQLDIFKDPGSSSGDFVGIQLIVNYAAFQGSVSSAEIPIYNTTNVNQTATDYSTEIKARMQAGTYLYDRTLNAPYTDPSVQA